MTASSEGMPMTDDWKTAADGVARKRRGAWVGSTVAFLIGGGFWGAGLALDGSTRLACLALGGIAVAIGFAYGTAIYMARVDEQERMANLWGAYVALCIYLALFGLNAMLGLLAIAIPHAEMVIFAATMAGFGVTFLWQRFR